MRNANNGDNTVVGYSVSYNLMAGGGPETRQPLGVALAKCNIFNSYLTTASEIWLYIRTYSYVVAIGGRNRGAGAMAPLKFKAASP